MRIVLLTASIATGCVEPLASDEVPMRDVFPAGTDVPWASGFVADMIDANDGVEGDVVSRLSGFANSARFWYWDFGAAPSFVAPLWKLYLEISPTEIEFVDHPPIWDVVPGDPGYSPFWAINLVEVSEKYAGEVITSRQGLEDAIREGLLETPEPALDDEGNPLYVNCPVVAEDTLLEVGGENGTVEAREAYYRGVEVAYFDFDENEEGHRPYSGQEIPVGTIYELTKVNETLPLSEPIRQVDMTGDGDQVDTNNIFDLYLEDGDRFTPLWQMVRVFVPADTLSIGDNRALPVAERETTAEFISDRNLFDVDADGVRTPVLDDEGNPYISGFEETDFLMNCPMQTAPGQI